MSEQEIRSRAGHILDHEVELLPDKENEKVLEDYLPLLENDIQEAAGYAAQLRAQRTRVERALKKARK